MVHWQLLPLQAPGLEPGPGAQRPGHRDRWLILRWQLKANRIKVKDVAMHCDNTSVCQYTKKQVRYWDSSGQCHKQKVYALSSMLISDIPHICLQLSNPGSIQYSAPSSPPSKVPPRHVDELIRTSALATCITLAHNVCCFIPRHIPSCHKRIVA